MDTYHAQLQSAEFSARTMKLGCYLFMAVVGLISFMNMANTMMPCRIGNYWRLRKTWLMRYM